MAIESGPFLRQLDRETCWICGALANPTREHKFKASYLRREFGRNALYVGVHGKKETLRLAQGARSKHLKFQSVICERCNTFTTQESDRAYDEFVELIERNGSDYEAYVLACNDQRFREDGSLCVPLLRYFAKLIGCHLADNNAPVPICLSLFVATETTENRIWLNMEVDPLHAALEQKLFKKQVGYAAHGGLTVYTRKSDLLPVSACSTATIGPIQFTFWYEYSTAEVQEMQQFYPEFIETCKAAAQKSVDGTSKDDLASFGR